MTELTTKRLAKMNETWDRGGVVRFASATTYFDIAAKSRDLVKVGKDGSLYLKRGKGYLCLDFCRVAFSA